MGTSFVGRRAELAILESACSRAAAEEAPVAVIVSGAPGSGKSRLLTELRLRQAAHDLKVAGYEAGTKVPLSAAADLLREFGKVKTAGGLLRELLFEPDAPRHKSLEPLRVFEAARQAVLALDGLVLLVVDDVQWLDELSVALCAYLVRSAVAEQKALAVIAAGRSSTQAAVFGDSLVSELGNERVETIELSPLDRNDGVRLIREVAPRLSQEESVEVWSRANGSPFWMGMLARGGERADVADYLAARQSGIGTDSGRLLALLAITTRPLAVSECGDALSWSDLRCDSAIAELERAGLATRHGDSLGIAHDLIRASVIERLPASRRRELHTALATWFERQAGADVQLLHEALVHRREAGGDITDLAIRVLQSPRRRLIGRSGLLELARVADDDALTEPVAVALRLSLAQLASELGEQQIALERWTSLASFVDDPTLRATAFLGASRAALLLEERNSDASRLLEAARREPTDDPVLAVEIESHRANLLQVVSRQAEAGRQVAFHVADEARHLWGRPAVEITTRERDAYVAALQVAFDAAVVEEDAAAQLRIADELSQVARGSEEGAVWADSDRASALMIAGRVGASLDARRRAWNRARERMLPMLTLTCGANLLSTLLDTGQLDEADEVISECIELEQRIAGAGERFAIGKVAAWSIHGLRHEAWLYRGEWPDAIKSLEQEIPRQPAPHMRMHLHWHIFVWLARCAAQSREHDVDIHLAACREDALAADCRRCSRELRLRTAEAFARLGRIDEAENQLLSWDDATRGAQPNDALWRRHVAGLIAVARHDPSGITDLEAVLAERERLGLTASLLWTRLDLAAALRESDGRRAAEELRNAGEKAAAVGASTVEQMADLGLRRMGVRTWRRGQAGRGERPLDRLSEREKQIAGLIAAGHSNPEIASRLFLSRKTVERHVSNILARTGTRNRIDLAGRLTEQRSAQ